MGKPIHNQNSVEVQSARESEVLQAHKLESVGRLASGIAHEINTPIQNLGDSLFFIESSLTDLLTSLKNVLEIATDPDVGLSGEALECVTVAVERADLEFIELQLPEALKQSIEGLARVSEILRSMKTFTYPDQREMAAVDLNDSIQTTLVISRKEYKDFADVEVELDASLPTIEAFGGEINQVLLNLIVNAAHAIEYRVGQTGDRGSIAITSSSDGTHVEVSVQDTGCGMTPEVMAQIFEPFFTTKAIGKGTGQGLAISRDIIVQKYGGSLYVQSAPGEGTTFTIRLPIRPAASLPLAA